MVNSDYSSVLIGVKNGATVRISESAPSVEKCGIGGDVLPKKNLWGLHQKQKSFKKAVAV